MLFERISFHIRFFLTGGTIGTSIAYFFGFSSFEQTNVILSILCCAFGIMFLLFLTKRIIFYRKIEEVEENE